MLKIKFVILSFFVAHTVIGQEFKDFYGKWAVSKKIDLEHIGSETKEEYAERIKTNKKCYASIFVIDNKGINANNNACEFLGCSSERWQLKYRTLKIVKDNAYTQERMGNEMVDSNIVGEKIVKLLNRNYSKSHLKIFDSKCSVGYGNSTLKVCIIDINHIGLYQDFNMILLYRDKVYSHK